MTDSTPTAALAGVPAGVQANGLWMGRRQLFVRFAAEAETATMYTPKALTSELDRLVRRSTYHSISISGRDPLGNTGFLDGAFRNHPVALPMMLDCGGQRPDAVDAVADYLALFQVTLDGTPGKSVVERATESLTAIAARNVDHALVLAPDEQSTDPQILRVISEVHRASEQTAIVVHPPVGTMDQDRRWLTFMEQASALHDDIRLTPRLPRPTGMR